MTHTDLMVTSPEIPETRPKTEDASTDSPVFESFRDRSLKTAGYAYLVGDAGLFASGIMSERHMEASSGLLWGIGGLVCAKYANPDAEKQLELLGTRLSHYLQKQGVEIPKNPHTKILTQDHGLVGHIEAFLHQYPSQVLNASYAIGATQMIRSGIQHNKHWDTATGALVAAGALAGLLIHEKKPDPERPPVGAFNKTVAWVQEKPLRVPGILYALNNVTLITSAANEWKNNPAQKSYLLKSLAAASYIFGNTMLTVSSKHHHGDESRIAMDKLATVSAQVIAAQAPEVREALIQNITGFLASQPDVTMKAPEISAMLHQKMRAVGQVNAEGWTQRLHDTNDIIITPSL